MSSRMETGDVPGTAAHGAEPVHVTSQSRSRGRNPIPMRGGFAVPGSEGTTRPIPWMYSLGPVPLSRTLRFGGTRRGAESEDLDGAETDNLSRTVSMKTGSSGDRAAPRICDAVCDSITSRRRPAPRRSTSLREKSVIALTSCQRSSAVVRAEGTALPRVVSCKRPVEIAEGHPARVGIT